MAIQIKIRELIESDFGDLLALAEEVYLENPMATLFYEKPSRNMFMAIFKEKIACVMEGRAVDIVAVCPRVIGECEIARKDGTTGILGIIISKDFRRKRIGSMLLGTASEKARGMGIEILEAMIAKENAGAIRFFSQCGFKRSSEKEGILTFRKSLH